MYMSSRSLKLVLAGVVLGLAAPVSFTTMSPIFQGVWVLLLLYSILTIVVAAIEEYRVMKFVEHKLYEMRKGEENE